ncbi:glycosyltransferase family 4 protein [Oceanicoccus sagamiensis]|uniref:Glycosyl transferase family 1 n=1 Tax=Oceanicoccus sagamiensis TaxID=716816 RepID=A0A1X9NJ78_9GAMM|nr:glycosyltransferase family 1 protein [Oceanicoccus sagamiensis]ARN74947.1 hypothetical protein BST96_12980 [Oceanicoccus sagamiensis]
MKIILEASALHPPLTGIGRYTYELAKRLPEQDDIDEVSYLFRGRLVKEIPYDPKQPHAVSEAPEPSHTAGNTKTKQAFYTRFRWLYYNRLTAFLLRACFALIARIGHWILYSKVHLKALLQPLLLFINSPASKDVVLHAPNFVAPYISATSILTIHDLSIFKYPECHPASRVKYLSKAIPKSVKRASYIITDSEFTRSEVIEYFNFDPKHVIAIPLGVDPAFKPRTAPDIHQALQRYDLEYGGYALTVSTLEPRKNITQLIQCYLQLPEEVSRQRPLVIIGGKGWGSAPIMELIKEGEARSALRYLNYVHEDDLPLLYAGAHAFMLLSLYEGFGLPVAEAMASGVPVLCSNVSSLPEVSNGASYLVDPHDPATIMPGLDTVLHDQAWREQAIAKGLEVSANYCWEEVANNVAAVYRLVQK